MLWPARRQRAHRQCAVCTRPARSGEQINSDVHASKNEPQKKSILCSCALNHNKQKHQQRQTITQHDAAWCLFWRLAAAKERQEERNNNQNGFFFCWGEGAISPEPKKDDGARCCGKGASVPHRACGGNKTQQSKRELHVDIPRKEKETTIKMFYSFLRGRAPFLRAKER